MKNRIIPRQNLPPHPISFSNVRTSPQPSRCSSNLSWSLLAKYGPSEASGMRPDCNPGRAPESAEQGGSNNGERKNSERIFSVSKCNPHGCIRWTSSSEIRKGESRRMCGTAQVGLESPKTAKPRGNDPTGFRTNNCPLKFSGLNSGSPGQTRTADQVVTSALIFLPGLDYLITRPRCLG
jgi:hypothetical protein